MRILTRLALLGIAAMGITALNDSASAVPINKTLGGVVHEIGTPIELVKSKSRKFGNKQARDAFINNRLSRMGVIEQLDGTILLPGIGENWISGPPHSFDPPHQRLGVPLGGTGGRLGIPSGGPGGRLDGQGHRLR